MNASGQTSTILSVKWEVKPYYRPTIPVPSLSLAYHPLQQKMESLEESSRSKEFLRFEKQRRDHQRLVDKITSCSLTVKMNYHHLKPLIRSSTNGAI